MYVCMYVHVCMYVCMYNSARSGKARKYCVYIHNVVT